MTRSDKLNERQLTLLRRINDGTESVTSHESSLAKTTYALRDRGLVETPRVDGVWTARITPAGRFYLEHGRRPDRQTARPTTTRRRRHATTPTVEKPAPQPVVWDGQPQEHAGMMWKPTDGATATFDEFVLARTRMREIHADAIWNSWIREDRGQELQDAMAVFDQWRRAEPGFRPMTGDEVEAWMAECDAKFEASRKESDRQRRERIPTYDEEREKARLSLLEDEAALRRQKADLAGLVDGSLFPSMDPARRTAEIASGESSLASREEAADRLRMVVGDPETVVDRQGRLPQERRELSLVGFSCWRIAEVQRLRTSIADLRSTLAAATDRAERSRVRDELGSQTRRAEILEGIPRLDAAVMCSECDHPMSWHDEARIILPEMGPCPAWPRWAERIRSVREMIMSMARLRSSEPEKPKPKPFAVIPSGLPIADVLARLTQVQTEHPDAVVKRGSANKWEIWLPQQSDEGPPGGSSKSSKTARVRRDGS